MVQVTIFKKQGEYHRIKCSGHAGYANAGQDIVCASISILVINTINAIETFTEDAFTVDTNEDMGLIDFTFTEAVSHDSHLLMDALDLGLTEIQNQYGKTYFTRNIEEV